MLDQGVVPAGGAILELGSQNLRGLSGEGAFLRHFIGFVREKAGLPPITIPHSDLVSLCDGGKMSRLMEFCGFEYRALDIFSDDKVLLFDLNLHDLPADLTGAFDLVTNFGTTEHVFDQVRAFRVIHDATKSGGVMYHDVPMGGYFHHGYFNYTPLFFRHLAMANDYDVVFDFYSRSKERMQVSPSMAKNGYGRGHYRDAAIEFAFRKIVDAPFRMPLDIGSGLGLDKSTWGRDVPYRVIDGAKAIGESARRSLLDDVYRAFWLLMIRSGRKRLLARLRSLLRWAS